MLFRRVRPLAIFVFTLLAIEFLDEFVFGAREAAWPLVRADLHLSYAEVGLLLSVPTLFANLIEPWLGILADVGKRRVIILGGGVVFMLSLVAVALSGQFIFLMLAFIFLNPASGAFVALSQSTLMDVDTSRHEQNMARWTLAGSIGVIGGSAIIGILGASGLSWRLLFVFGAFLALILVIVASRFSFSNGHEEEDEMGFVEGLKKAFTALKRGEVLRWLVLLEFGNLTADVLYAYLALYLVDVAGISPAQAGLAVTIWTGVGLIGDVLVIPLLERVRGLTILRFSVLAELILFPAFLLVPGVAPKLILLALLGLCKCGWYPILRGQLYSTMPGQSGTVLALDNVAGLVAGVIPLTIGILAEHFGLSMAVWVFMLGPVVLWIGLPRRKPSQKSKPVLM